MSGELVIDGRLVATLDLTRSYSQPPDHVMLFRRTKGWAALLVARDERYDDEGNLAGAEAWAYVKLVDDAAGLKELADRRGWDWWTLLDHTHSEDAELYAAWVPERMDRDLHASSIYNKDLATTDGYFVADAALPAPGRALPLWQAEAMAVMAVHLENLGWVVAPPQHNYRGEVGPDADPVLGVLTARRYGYEVAIVVRVDCCGEIFARRPDDDDVAGPVLRPLTESEEDELGDELRRRRYAAAEASERRERGEP